MSVAIPNYRLAPQVRIEDIVDDTIAAMNWLSRDGPAQGIATDRVVVSGHSAGGHLTAALFAAEAGRLEFDPARIAGGVAFSGVFEFDPLLHFSYNSDLKLDPASVARLNLARRRRSIAAPLVVAAGAAESAEFQRQSELLTQAWHPQARLLMLPGLNHFGIVDSFAERGQPLHRATLALF